MSKVIVITGAGSGLGRALGERLAADGEHVVLLGRTASKVEALAARIGDRAMAVGCDVSSPEDVRRAFAAIAERHGRIDVLINNAAIFTPSTVAEASEEHILGVIGANLTGAMLCTRAAIPLMPSGGQVLSVSSEAVEVPFPHLSAYQASKAGLERFTKTMHRELESLGLRATVVRAGQMMGEEAADRELSASLDVLGRFMEAANNDYALKLGTRPSTSYTSATNVFRFLIDQPPDMRVISIWFDARAAE